MKNQKSPPSNSIHPKPGECLDKDTFLSWPVTKQVRRLVRWGHSLEDRWSKSGFTPPDWENFREVSQSFFAQSPLPDNLQKSTHLTKALHRLVELQNLLIPMERWLGTSRKDAEILIHSLDRTEPIAQLPMVLVLDNIRSAFNVGGIFRTADFFGVQEVLLCGYTTTPAHPKTQHSAMGTDNWVAWRHFRDIFEALTWLKDKDYRLMALETCAQAQSLYQSNFQKPCAFIFGNERFGLSPAVIEACDEVIAIPGLGQKNSLNVVTSVGTVLGEALRQTLSDKEPPL